MRRFSGLPQLLTVLAAFFLNPCPARADDVPVEILRYWQFYNDTGWTYIRKGEYTKAEERFGSPSRRSGRSRRMSNGSWRGATPTWPGRSTIRGSTARPSRWPSGRLSVREAYVKTNPDAVFQSLYTLAMIHSAQAHFDQAEVLLRRAMELQEQAIGPGHVQTAATVNELAGDLPRAEEVQGRGGPLQAGHRHPRAVRPRGEPRAGRVRPSTMRPC